MKKLFLIIIFILVGCANLPEDKDKVELKSSPIETEPDLAATMLCINQPNLEICKFNINKVRFPKKKKEIK